METKIHFSGMGFEVGQSRNGLNLSTDFARKYFPTLKIMGLSIADHGDIAPQNSDRKIKITSESDLYKIQWEKYHKAYLKTLALLADPIPLLNWGGDHSIAISTVGAFCHKFPEGHVVWIDAHADLNLPDKSLSGNLHGMPLAVLMNIEGIATKNFEWLKSALNPQKLIYIGLRDIDPFEMEMIESLNIKTYFYSDVQNLGMDFIAKEILQTVEDRPLHVSFDIDGLDPQIAPSTGVPVENGLNLGDLYLLSDYLIRRSNFRSIDIVEINPEIGSADEVHQTYTLAFNFLQSIFNNNFPGGNHDCTGPADLRKQSFEIEWNF